MDKEQQSPSGSPAEPVHRPGALHADLSAAVERVRGGDRGAFEALVAGLERPLRAWLVGRAWPGIDVDEVAQRAFVQAYVQLHRFEPGSDFAAWLFTLASFELRTEMNRARRTADYHSRFASDLLEEYLSRQEQPGGEPELRIEHLERCLSQLDGRHRELLGWRYREQVSLVEIGERLGRSVPAIKKALWKLRGRLRECVELSLAGQGESA